MSSFDDSRKAIDDARRIADQLIADERRRMDDIFRNEERQRNEDA